MVMMMMMMVAVDVVVLVQRIGGTDFVRVRVGVFVVVIVEVVDVVAHNHRRGGRCGGSMAKFAVAVKGFGQ